MIPVLPMPVVPGLGADPVFGPDLRASDIDRDVAADVLCAAVADGRLSLAELDQRLEDVLSARTLREIARVMSDLPSPGFTPPAQARRATRPDRPVRVTRPETRWSLLQSLLTPAAPAAAGPG
jgi:hypothetical protein